MVLVKGAPDRLLDRCATQLSEDGGSRPLDRTAWDRRIDELGGQGLRVLAAAWRPAIADSESLGLGDLDAGLEFVGVVGIADPPRPEAIEAIASCHSAGIRVKMITGDHAGTATAIAREMGIIGADAPPAVTGAELEQATDEQLKTIVESADVFARTSPEHKLRLVRALQRNGEVVAMTGDGVNDAPALKRADIGVAMGIKGTEATKQAAGMVLADDNFATIERAVQEGRRIYDNLQKSVVFLIPTNGAQSLVILVAVLLGLTLPLDPVQILWVNLVTAVTLSLALAYEPGEPDLMDRPPRPAKSHILEPMYLPPIALASLLIAGATIGIFLYGQSQGLGLAVTQTMAVNTLVLAQVTYLFNARHLRESSLNLTALTGNPVVWIVIGGAARSAGPVRLPALHEQLVQLRTRRALGLVDPAGLRGGGLLGAGGRQGGLPRRPAGTRLTHPLTSGVLQAPLRSAAGRPSKVLGLSCTGPQRTATRRLRRPRPSIPPATRVPPSVKAAFLAFLSGLRPPLDHKDVAKGDGAPGPHQRAVVGQLRPTQEWRGRRRHTRSHVLPRGVPHRS